MRVRCFNIPELPKNIDYTKPLTEDFIRKYKSKIDWTRISIYQKLSEGLIREFSDKVDWRCISLYQRHLSPEFRREFNI